MLALQASALKGADANAVVDVQLEFLIHEKFDVETNYRLMGHSSATNAKIARAYAKVVARTLETSYGGYSISDALWAKNVTELEQRVVKLYDVLDQLGQAKRP